MLQKLVCAATILFCMPCTASDSIASEPNERIGRPLTELEQQQLNSHVFANGIGLPAGNGSVVAGAALYKLHCAACHGGAGEGANSVELVGDRSLLTSDYPDKGVGVYWPYAPTLFEYISRAMPPASPGSFSSEELYSIVGYVLHLNELLPAIATVNKAVLSEIDMPNRDGFIDVWPAEKN